MMTPFTSLARDLHLGRLAITLTLSITLFEGAATFLQGGQSHELEIGQEARLTWQQTTYASGQGLVINPGELSTRPYQDPKVTEGLLAIPQTGQRLCTRMFFVYPNASIRGTSAGQYAIQYGQPDWRQEYEEGMEDMPGTIMRFGKDFWSTLDSSLNLTIADTEVPAGYYYLALACKDVGEFYLHLYDPADIKKHRFDAVQSERVIAPAIEIPLELEELDRPARQLIIEFTRDEGGSLHESTLNISWGPFHLTAPVIADLNTPR